MAKGTGITLEEDELKVVRALFTSAYNTPTITFSSTGPDMASVAWKIAKEKIHKYALSHGLPEIEGYYGPTLKQEKSLTTNRSNYMAAYMRDYRNHKFRGKSKGFFHTGLHRFVNFIPGRCPGCSILSPTICLMCEIEGVMEGRATKKFQLTALALL